LQYQTTPSPKLSNHPASKHHVLRKIPKIGGNTFEILKELGVDQKDVQKFFKDSKVASARL